ncbi:MAG: hypothetical protein IPJ41_10780 [Phycisphaerales bacterium]|nr:hypothetical protein [Phycisphaerales bacterium]
MIEDAGALGAVMIATNMAGRGTDIKLGLSSREQLLEHWLRRGIASRGLTLEASDDELRENVYRKIAPAELDIQKRDADAMDFADLELRLLRHWANKNTWAGPGKIDTMNAEELREELDRSGRCLLHRIRWFESIEDLGGLHVIGTERHESRRIDNQLRGRSGRQGDKGSSRFFVSLEDDLMKMFAGETTMKVLSRLGMKEGDAIEHPMLSKSVERAQRKVEERNFQVRKNILEYDEVMEHQRQKFYGLRQRVLEGREVRELIFDYISDAIDDACGMYLDSDYPAECVAEYAREQFDFSVPPERLRGKDADEMDVAVRKIAAEEARHMIDVTLGEYIPIEGAEIAVDFDSAGLVSWAKSRFDVDLNAAEIRAGGAAERKHIYDMLSAAAEARIGRAELPKIQTFTTPTYGAQRLVEWCKSKFGIEVTVEQIVEAVEDEDRRPRDVVLQQADALYTKREIEYPVDFVMQMTMSMARQNPQAALAQLATWAKRRHGFEWTEETVKTTPPQQVRQQLLDASAKFVHENVIEHEVEAAQACADDESLDAHFRERFGVGLPDAMRFLEPDERPDAIRSRVENLLRAELLYLERTILLEVLDTTWKDHLYAMDQLRDSIGFRSFSQQDPRIEFKREGSRLFHQMDQSVRDRVTDYIFKARINPGAGAGAVPGARPAPPARSPGPVPSGFGGSISGPGLA